MISRFSALARVLRDSSTTQHSNLRLCSWMHKSNSPEPCCGDAPIQLGLSKYDELLYEPHSRRDDFVPLEKAMREATQSQTAAAQDASGRVRVIAGPGSGKSKVIEERIQWLLEKGIDARHIVAISFTNASVKDLKSRILRRCEHISTANAVRVSTLHSLALTLLKSVGQLAQYPANPKALNDWELEAIFDPEFGQAEQIPQKSRQQNIRFYHEALWETG